MSTFAPGDRVRLTCSDNATLDGQLAVVEALESWGAHVKSVAPTWPGSTSSRYRAGWGEMIPVREPVVLPPVRAADMRNRADERAREEGYSGDACSNCGSFRMKRTGVCLCCEDCGSTSGGCS